MLVFTAHFWPHVGGVERHALELWGRLVQRGWRVQLVTSNTEAAPERETVRGIDVVRLPSLDFMEKRWPVPLPSRAWLRVALAKGHAAPDVVVTNTRFFPTTFLGQLFARTRGIPSLHIEHGSDHAVTGSRVGDGISQAIDYSAGVAVLRSATRCVGVSGAVVEFMRRLGRSDAGVLYNGVDSQSFHVDGGAERAALGAPDGVPLILFIGRLFADKGVLALWDAFERTRRETGAHLVLAGDGPLGAELRSRANGRSDVRLLGFVDPARIPGLLAASDIVAHPSACAEGMPSVVLEAAAAGRAILATTVGGTPEIVQDGESGLLVAPSAPAALEAALRRLCGSAALRAQLGNAARLRCGAIFDWERVADSAEHELRQLMRHAAS